MNTKTARKLKVNQRVMWKNNPQDLGTVIEVGYCATKILWDNGQISLVRHDDMHSIDLTS